MAREVLAYHMGVVMLNIEFSCTISLPNTACVLFG